MRTFIRFSLLILAIFFLFNTSYAAEKYSPVVKVKSYKSIYWKYIQELWWGSASVISDDWYMVTNNHVVDDGEGNVSDYFNICLTFDDTKKPKCNFTASLVDRSKDLDIAVLKIDTKDIFWNDVDYTEIWKLDIDYTYNVNDKWDVFAIWYPWIGSETITKTKWIVSWTIDYNSYKYIKSDTLIAWWNSGWALLSSAWKLIWVPTFLVWSWFDASIWYSLFLWEAKDFILTSLLMSPSQNSDLSNFVVNKITIDNINEKENISWDFLNLDFDDSYEVKNYIKDKSFDIEPRLADKYLPSIISYKLFETVKINSQEDLFYMLEKAGFYYKGYQKLKEKNIGWLKFYYPVVIWDTTAWEFSPFWFYFSQVWDNKLALIMIRKPFTWDIQTDNKINENTDKLLSWFDFKLSWTKKIDFSYETNLPKIKIKSVKSSASNDMFWTYELYFWNLYDVFTINLVEMTSDNWKWKSVEEIYKNETLDIDDDFKSMIKYKWRDWFIYCDNSDNYVEDPNWATIKQNVCNIHIYWWLSGSNEKQYMIIWKLEVNKNKIEKYLDLANYFLDKWVNIKKVSSWETNLVNIYKNIVALDFVDMKYQADDYKNALKKLVKYDLLENDKNFNPDRAIKWKEFLVNYFRMVYNYDFNYNYDCILGEYSCLFMNNNIYVWWESRTMQDVFNEMNIPLDEYVDYSKVSVFIDHIKLLMSGASWFTFSEKWYNDYLYLSEESMFEPIKNMVDEYNNLVYWKEEMYIWELLWTYWVSSSVQTKDIYYNSSSNKIIYIDLYETWKYNYSSRNANRYESTYNNYCIEDNMDVCYRVMTKSLMIDTLMPMINFTLFDESLKNRKWTTFE